MNVSFIQEPELEFGTGKHIDIRFGLLNYGPFDFSDMLSPKDIKLGIVGTAETIEGVERWLERCKDGLPAKESKQPNLFPKFPGFGPDTNLRASLVTDARLQRPLPQRELEMLCKNGNVDEVVSQAVNMFISDLQYLVQSSSIDVLICAIPMNLLIAMQGDEDVAIERTDNEDNERPNMRLDFHDLLKAKAMVLRKPIQIILPMTYDDSKRLKQRQKPDKPRQIQDEATRAWNLYTALYYKAGGTPWRLIRESSELTTCYVGISFYKALDGSTMQTSLAQVFNERGDGVILRGAAAQSTKEDRQPHLAASDAYHLISGSLNIYRQEHHTLPARIVIHKSSRYSDDEVNGFREALSDNRIYSADLISLYSSSVRLFRMGEYPPLRGTLLTLDSGSGILYTKGSVDFFSTYPGMYVPRTLGIRYEDVEQTSRFLAREILALTKMNWNRTQFDDFNPITIRAAREVGDILKYLGSDEQIEPRYSFYI